MTDTIKNDLLDIVSPIIKIDKETISAATSLKEFSIKSLDAIEILSEIEDKFGIDIPNENAERLLNLTEAETYIRDCLNKKDA